ncbi:tropomyosin [Eurytemora carolleeae]|uniref:tropomyosin n=1 Tax=Eurytemora carolleeae TaxID=1294199 RepID=UPI000C76E6BE|nr:tropomyosin [Eurytemora carolleeae]|eukprot:XP_023330633.1 tropomyosin-like [Eurytemora affinis]
MDAIRKKMQSLKGETESLYATIRRFEEATAEYSARADQADCDLRDYGKKVQQLEIGFDETNDKLLKATESLEEKEKLYKEVEGDVAALSRRIMLMEEEAKKSETNLADTVTKLAVCSRDADTILKAVKVVESKNMNNEVTIEELDKNLRSTIKMAHDNEQKLDEVSRKLGVQECELKRGIERAELAEKNLKKVEEELESVGENMKVLENSASKALEKEEKLVDKILQLQHKYKAAEARFEYGEMNITKLNHRIDDIEDEIYREKLKIKRTADELNDTFDDMMNHY